MAVAAHDLSQFEFQVSPYLGFGCGQRSPLHSQDAGNLNSLPDCVRVNSASEGVGYNFKQALFAIRMGGNGEPPISDDSFNHIGCTFAGYTIAVAACAVVFHLCQQVADGLTRGRRIKDREQMKPSLY